MIVVNKWDAVEQGRPIPWTSCTKSVREGLAYMTYAPVLFISALTGLRVDRML